METTVISSIFDNSDYKLKYCNCLSKICGCEINSPLTKGFIDSLLKYFQINDMENASTNQRFNTIHLWGTQDKSAKDIEKWLLEYMPFRIEWINDFTCNLDFDSVTDCFKVFENFTEEYEVDQESDFKVNDPEFCLTTGIWRQVINLPDGTEKMFMRLANKNDEKIRGSERKSQYYLNHGNPRYGNVKGLVSKSYREQLKRNRRSEDVSVDSRLVAYDDLPELNTVKSPERKTIRKSSPISEESRSDKESDDEQSVAKKRKMISSMRLYSDRLGERSHGERVKTNRNKGSVHSRLGSHF